MIEGHVVVTDLGFGDAGKGVVTDRLAAAGASLVVRFSGGAQAAHNVVAKDRHHTFHQFGSGTLAGVPTHLGKHVLVNPHLLVEEAADLIALGVQTPMSKLSVDPWALLTTPIHAAANRAREDARGAGAHGSTGLGIGETTSYARDHDAPRVLDTLDVDVLARKLTELAEHYAPLLAGTEHRHPSIDEMVDVLASFRSSVWITPTADLVRNHARMGRIVFEGSQGVLLDEWNGFHPHTTWATVTSEHAREIAAECGLDVTVLGVTRAYLSRHGAGPFPTEDPDLFELLPERHNAWGRYQGAWRVGHLDLPLLKYAVAANSGIDALAVTHLDYIEANPGAVKVCRDHNGAQLDVVPDSLRMNAEDEHLARLEAMTTQLAGVRPQLDDMDDPCAELEDALGVPVVMRGYGPERLQADWVRT